MMVQLSALALIFSLLFRTASADPSCVEPLVLHALLEQAETVIQASVAVAVRDDDLARWRAHVDAWIGTLESQAPAARDPVYFHQAIDWLRARLQDNVPRTDCPALLTRHDYLTQRERYLALASPIEEARTAEEQSARRQATTYYLHGQIPEWKADTPVLITSELEWAKIADRLALDPIETSRLLRQLFDRSRGGTAVRVHALIQNGTLRASLGPLDNEHSHWPLLGIYRPEPDFSRLSSTPRQHASGVNLRAVADRAPMIYPQANVPVDPALTDALRAVLPTDSGATVLRVVRLIDHHAFTHRADIQVPLGVEDHVLIIPIYVNLSQLDPGRVGVVQINAELKHLVGPWSGVLISSLLRWMSTQGTTPLVRQHAMSLGLLQNTLLSVGLTLDLKFDGDNGAPAELRIRRATSTRDLAALGSVLMPSLAATNQGTPLTLLHLPRPAARALITFASHWNHAALIQAIAARIDEELRIARNSGRFGEFVRNAFIPFAAEWDLFPEEIQSEVRRQLMRDSRTDWRTLVRGQHHSPEITPALGPTGTH